MKPKRDAEWGGKMEKRWRWSKLRMEWGRFYYKRNRGGVWWQWETE
jgi:hypothetical protein